MLMAMFGVGCFVLGFALCGVIVTAMLPEPGVVWEPERDKLVAFDDFVNDKVVWGMKWEKK